MAKRASEGAETDLDAIFQALAHPIRREILEQLAEAPPSVGELADPHVVSRAAVSNHLPVLEDRVGRVGGWKAALDNLEGLLESA